MFRETHRQAGCGYCGPMRRAVGVTVIAALAWSWACSKDDNEADADDTTADEGAAQDDSSPSDDGSSDGAGGNPNDSQSDDMSADDTSADDSSDDSNDDTSADDMSADDDGAEPVDDEANGADDTSDPDDSTADDGTVDDAEPGDDPAADDDAMSGAGGTTGAGGEPGMDMAGMDMEGAGGAGDASDAGGEVTPGADSASDDGSMSFFVTSVGGPDGGNFGGVDGADAFCAELAAAVSADLADKPWRAYLSVADEDARDRIGTGPWRNANGDVIANDIDELHDQDMGALDATWPPADLGIALTETGEEVTNSEHDILTGTQMDGTWDEDLDCEGWTSNSSDLEATVGHSNRDGGGRPPYFNATHQVGCAPTTGNYEDGTISAGGGRGSIYCFVRIVE